MGKLTRAEIDNAIEKIVKRYDEYVYRFFKSPKLKTAFEGRYFSAVKNNMDMERFLSAEIEVIEQILKTEEDNLSKEIAPAPQETKKEDFADQVVKELRVKIEKYPAIRIHKDANPEIRHLLGALNELEGDFTPPLQDALKNTNYAFNTQTMMNLDAQLRSLSSIGSDGVSSRLTRYFNLMNHFPRDYQAIDREEKSFIMEVSFFLHDLYDILTQVNTEYRPMTKSEKENLKKVMTYLEGLIDDFRLKDFKRKNF